jgi:hypothetical protein
MIFPPVLCGSGTLSPTTEEEHRLSVFENWVLRKIFGPKTYKITAGWKRLHNVKLQDLCSSPNIILLIKSKGMKWAGYVHIWRRGEMHTRFWW